MSLFKKILLDSKIYFRINSRYKKMFPGSAIKSILSSDVEKKILPGTIIEEGVRINNNIDYIGRRVYIGEFTRIYNCSFIGNFTSISGDVKIGLVRHPKNFISTSPAVYHKKRGLVDENLFDNETSESVYIGNDVLISANVMVLNGIKIGNGAIIGAGTLVNKNVEPYSIVAGVPAKVIGYRFEARTCELLQRSEWWNLTEDQLRNLKSSFNNPEEFLRILNRSTVQ